MFVYIAEAFTVLTCVFALSAGGLPERLAGGWLLVNATVFGLLQLFQQASPTLCLINDGVFSIGLLPLAMIFVSFGVGAMTLIQAMAFAVEAYYLLFDRPIDQLYVNLTNAAALALTFSLLVSTLASTRARRRHQPHAPLNLATQGPPGAAGSGCSVKARTARHWA